MTGALTTRPPRCRSRFWGLSCARDTVRGAAECTGRGRDARRHRLRCRRRRSAGAHARGSAQDFSWQVFKPPPRTRKLVGVQCCSQKCGRGEGRDVQILGKDSASMTGALTTRPPRCRSRFWGLSCARDTVRGAAECTGRGRDARRHRLRCRRRRSAGAHARGSAQDFSWQVFKPPPRTRKLVGVQCCRAMNLGRQSSKHSHTASALQASPASRSRSGIPGAAQRLHPLCLYGGDALVVVLARRLQIAQLCTAAGTHRRRRAQAARQGWASGQARGRKAGGQAAAVSMRVAHRGPEWAAKPPPAGASRPGERQTGAGAGAGLVPPVSMSPISPKVSASPLPSPSCCDSAMLRRRSRSAPAGSPARGRQRRHRGLGSSAGVATTPRACCRPGSRAP